MKICSSIAALGLALSCTAVGCVADTGDTPSEEDDLTSISARSRSLAFDGYVYVAADASDDDILYAVRSETQTAFGALRNARIGVNNRELKAVDAKTFTKTKVTVVDENGATTPMLKVKYRYTDMAVVPVDMAKRSAIGLAVMSPDYRNQTQRILTECTANDSEAQEFSSSIWYVFDPSLPSCRTAMSAEQKTIDAANAKLADPKAQVSKAEVERLYITTTVKLGADKTNKGASYPEYDRLFTGGVQKGKLVVSMVNGFIGHAEPQDYTDSGYREWMEQLRESIKGRSYTIAKVDPQEDLTSFKVNGKTVKANGIEDLIAWELDGTPPADLSWSDMDALNKAVGQKLIQHWLTLDSNVTVKIGSAAQKPLTLEILTYFGSGGDAGPHKQAIKNSDVFLYNGHSYIGYGPLDPSNFSASDFPSSYQIMFIDGCVSYNYYEKDYIPLKSGGTKNLDLITNGLEAPSYHSGYALGRFVSELTSGRQPSYKDLLTVASDTDSLRVVDGEVDNAYSPKKTPITLH